MRTLAQAFALMNMSVRSLEGGWHADVVFPKDFPVFQGHFPGYPLLPAVVQIALGLRVLSLGTGREATLQTIIQSKFMVQIRPDQPLSVRVSPHGDAGEDMPEVWNILIRRTDGEQPQAVAQCRVRVEWN